MAVSAQFWGPRFAEAAITQAMIDYQAHFPQWHNTAPPDPVVTPSAARSLAVPEADDGPSNDPLVGEEQLRAAMR